jgi:hypothetical protein
MVEHFSIKFQYKIQYTSEYEVKLGFYFIFQENGVYEQRTQHVISSQHQKPKESGRVNVCFAFAYRGIRNIIKLTINIMVLIRSWTTATG